MYTQKLVHEYLSSILFIISKTVERTKYSLIDEWINKICSIHTMGCYSGIERTEVLLNATTLTYPVSKLGLC
jgi:hypothetical protein